jgi:DNA polymerase delta subunit 1
MSSNQTTVPKPFVLLYIIQRDIDSSPNSIQRAGITVYGKDEDGTSICIEVTGFLPYFYFHPGTMLTRGEKETHETSDPIEDLRNETKKTLDSWLKEKVSPKRLQRLDKGVEDVEIVSLKDVWGYNDNEDFVKVTLAHPNLVTTLRSILGTGTPQPLFGKSKFVTYESDILFIQRWMIDKNLVGGGWMQIKEGSVFQDITHLGITNCDIHIKIDTSYIESLPLRSDHAQINIFSFDIECAGRVNEFPVPEIDPVIQISSVTWIFGKGEPIKVDARVHVLGTCDEIAGGKIESFRTERELLLSFSNHFVKSRPDIVTGYNICNFDIPYLIKRSETLGIGKQFCKLSKRKDQVVELKDSRFESKAHGVRESKQLVADGFFLLDILQVIQRDYKLRTYTLNSVSQHFLGDKKDDVPHNQITSLHNGDSSTRAILAKYCLKDSILPLRLIVRLMIFYNYMEMARVCKVPINFLLERGQSIKVMTQILSRAKEEGYVIPYKEDLGLGTSGEEDTYEGATVIEPERGFYNDTVVTLDFASLYPSIMMAHNLCYSTLIKRKNVPQNVDEISRQTPLGPNVRFVTTEHRKGLLPKILESLISARKQAKRELAAETDEFKKNVLDGRQLALKISANSVYGFTGAKIGKLPCFEISASVTSYGRQMIKLTRKVVRKHYTKANGYPEDAQVIYGDTDSVMVRFGYPNTLEGRKEAMRIGKEAAAMVTKHFINPINLEFEKIYCPYLLINKKRYAGLFWTKAEKYDKMDAKGIESVRRDSCPFAAETIKQSLSKLLNNPEDTGIAIEYVKQRVSDLIQNKVDPSKFSLTKKLKPPDSYANPQPHATLYKKLLKRDKNSAPAIGDRVPFIIRSGTKNEKTHERAEDPLYAIVNGIGLDAKYYLEKQLMKPLTRIFNPVMGEKKVGQLFEGEHTRKIVQTTNKTGIFKYCQTVPKCLKCNVSIKRGKGGTLDAQDKNSTKVKRDKVEITYEGEHPEKEGNVKDKANNNNNNNNNLQSSIPTPSIPPVCGDCKHHEGKVFMDLMYQETELHNRIKWLTDNCFKCKDEPNSKVVICSNFDCEFYFERYKKINDSQTIRKKLKRFENATLDPLDKRSIGVSELEW